MPDYSDMDMQTLMDLLVKHTDEYTKMRTFSTYTVEEIAQRKQSLWELQMVIKTKTEQAGATPDYIIPGLPDYYRLEDPDEQQKPRK